MSQDQYRCVCGGESSLLLWEGPLFGVPEAGVRQIRGCERCGLGRLWPPMSEAQKMEVTSASDAAELHRPPTGFKFSLEHTHNASKALLCDWVLREMPAGSEVLDIGCGAGWLCKALAGGGLCMTGLDPAPEPGLAAECAPLGVHIMASTLEDYDPGERRFDAIIFSHVLEHITEPQVALARARDLLKPGGKLFVELPHLQRPLTSLKRCASPQHIWYFTPEALRYHLQRVGLQPLKERVFRLYSFQTVAAVAPEGPQESPPNTGSAARSQALLARHRWLYYARLQFIWRKLPWVRRAIFFGWPQVKRY